MAGWHRASVFEDSQEGPLGWCIPVISMAEWLNLHTLSCPGLQSWCTDVIFCCWHIWSMVLRVWSWAGAEQHKLRIVTIWDVLTHLLCQSLYRFSTDSRHLNQLHILLLCKRCLFLCKVGVYSSFTSLPRKITICMWVIEKALNSTIWYDFSLIVVFRLCNFIKICRVQFPSIISAFKIPTELNLQEA